MSTPVADITIRRAPGLGVKRLLTALEVDVFFACILLYIWRWQHTHAWLWAPLLAALLATHLLHGDRLADLGLTRHELGASARLILPLALAVYLLLTAWGFWSGRLHLLWPSLHAVAYFFAYGAWCLAQQYLTQSYFNNRLLAALRNRRLSALLVGLMFGAAHIPNPVLMAATALAGFVFAEVFARHRNLWPLALAQAVGGFLIAALAPAALIHNMRVGPGYYFYNLR